MKCLFLIICFFSIQAFPQTACEKAKQSLRQAEIEYEKASVASVDEKHIPLKRLGVIATTDVSASKWREALRTWIRADKDDLKAREDWDKADKKFDMQHQTRKQSIVAGLEVRKIKAKINKFCKKEGSINIQKRSRAKKITRQKKDLNN